VPLLESMYHQVPIVAYTNTAVPETVATAGLVLPDKQPARVAAAIHRVVTRLEPAGSPGPGGVGAGGVVRLPRVKEGFASASKPPTRRDRAGGPPPVVMRVSFVVPRYGPAIIGGPRPPPGGCRGLVSERGWDVEVLTSGAEDFVTWEDVYPAGEELITGCGSTGSGRRPGGIRRSMLCRRTCWPIRGRRRWPTPNGGWICRAR